MLTVGEWVKINNISLVPVNRLRTYSQSSAQGGWWYGSKEPFAVVVSAPGMLEAFELGRGRVPLADLLKQVPALAGVLRQK